MKNDRVYTAKQMKRDLKRARRKQEFERKKQEVLNWVDDHRDLVMVLAPVGIGLTTVVVKTTAKVVTTAIQAKAERDTKDLYVYDRSLGHYWRLRRELTNEEWVEIDARKSNGERLGDILDSMKVLE